MEFLVEYQMPVIVGICLALGYVVKQWVSDVDNKYIPTMCAVVGLVLAAWINAWTITPDIILSGMVSGLSATGLHQAFKQFVEGK